MVIKGHWFFLPYSVDKELPGLRLIPSGVKEDRYRRLQWLGDYRYSNLNSKTLPISALSTMQYFRALERLIREVVISNPALELMNVLKVGVSAPYGCSQTGASFSIRGKWRGVTRNTNNPTYGVEKLAAHISHGKGDSGGSSKCSLTMQYPCFTA